MSYRPEQIALLLRYIKRALYKYSITSQTIVESRSECFSRNAPPLLVVQYYLSAGREKTSGVQRVLHARCQRCSWMPSSQTIFPIPIHLTKFLTTFFVNSSPQNPEGLFSRFLDARDRKPFSLTFMHFPLFSNICIHFFQKTPSLDAPRLDAMGRRTLWHPLCTPLKKTVYCYYISLFRLGP